MEAVKKLQAFDGDVFRSDPAIMTQWRQSFSHFQSTVELIEVETVTLIKTAFDKNLSSSANAFNLLENFKNIDTRPMIKEEIKDKYEKVLEQYQKELINMDELFELNHKNPPIPKNMPENSGAIVWSRSIIKRVKTPIEQFKTKEGMLTQWKTGKAVAKKYVQLAKKLADDYETYKYTVWKN